MHTKTAIIYMGGTFGCIGQPLKPMPAREFIQQIHVLFSAKHNNIQFFAAPTIRDSSELQASDWLKLSLFIQNLRHNFEHFIVIHGTDTLSYAAAMLHHIFSDEIYIIFTGSQKPLLDQLGQNIDYHSDALNNLNSAIEHIQSCNKGVYVSFAEHLHPASSTYKASTTNFDAFIGHQAASDHLSKSLHLLDELLANTLTPLQNLRILNFYLFPVDAQSLYESLKNIQNDPPDILILQSYGSGNIPYTPMLKDFLECLTAKGCWVIISSQVLYGELSQQYATGSWLKNMNLIFDPHYSQADLYARAVLMYASYGHLPDGQHYWIDQR